MSFIILDRDGVINFDSDEYIKSPDEWIPIPGSLEAIAQLNRAGFRILVATNQSGIGRGLYDVATLDAIHEKMQSELASVGGYIEAIFFCPHHPNKQCLCRKPKPGLLCAMQKKYPIEFAKTFFIGDKWTDVEAARAVGCQPLLIKSNHLRDFESEKYDVQQFSHLKEAVNYILR